MVFQWVDSAGRTGLRTFYLRACLLDLSAQLMIGDTAAKTFAAIRKLFSLRLPEYRGGYRQMLAVVIASSATTAVV
jgi:hypothetical protein